MRENSINWLKFRIFFVFFLLFISFILIFVRVLQLQVREKERLQELAERQHQRMITLVPSRGTIYDRNLGVLAESTEIDSLYAHPRQIENPSKVARKIARVLEMKKSTIEKKLRYQKPFVWLQRKISPEKAERIKRLEIKGAGFLKESQRYYPNLALAANVLGFVGIDSQGLEGVELQYDRYLRGQTHRFVVELDARGGEIITGDSIPPTDLSSRSVVLTIDLDIQHNVEKALSLAVKETRARSGMVVVMDPRTGRILAMASRPSFNPNSIENYGPRAIRNRTITDIFEPGSIFKVFLLAAALEEKLVKRDEIFFCNNGTYRIGKDIIHDHEKHGWLTLQKIIKFSSNIGASQIGLRIGAKRLDRYIRNFGFGASTGINLPGEVNGIVRKPETLSEVGIANTSFGQGISVTAIQLVSALSSIANGGILMRPYVVDQIIDQRGKVVKSFNREPLRRVISPETCLEVARIMKQVVEPGGTGVQAALPGYAVAGKTGTAQKIDPLLKTYADNKYIGSFMGFVPADRPRLAILVVIDEPEGTPYGGVLAAPVFRAIALHALQRLKIPPKKVVAQIEKSREYAARPKKRDVLPKGTKKVPAGTMPDLSGLSLRQVLKSLMEKNLDIRISGRGVLQEQEPHPGARLREGTTCYLRFAPSS
jgi:cell division protein FtsI (penicillin-binding protein 3)